MVMGVCKRILGDDHAAEDAFQSTFIIFVKKAAGLRNRSLLDNWLYGVALRVAKKERSKLARRRTIERLAAEQTSETDDASGNLDLRALIDDEIRRLPERYRTPLILCHLQGLRHDEVARRLGCPVGTVESRLSRARAHLRDRLSDRGMAPKTSAMLALLKSSAPPTLDPSLINGTILAASSAPSFKTGVVPVFPLGWFSPERLGFVVPTIRACAAFASAIAVAGVALALTYPRPIDTPNPRPNESAPKNSSQLELPEDRKSPQKGAAVPKENALARQADAKVKLATNGRLARSPSARALPLNGITIDGNLDDWPTDLEKHYIKNQLFTHDSYNSKPLNPDEDPRAYFMAGYDARAERIYLAVVVHDDDLVASSSGVLQTDAVEVYITANLDDSGRSIKTAQSEVGAKGLIANLFNSDGALPQITLSGNWRDTLDATTMPVHQYVAIPSKGAAYDDPWRLNPSLVYARSRDDSTKMKYRHEDGITTYEWSIRPFERFPDLPASVAAGRRFGLDIAVVDKHSSGTDRAGKTVKAPPPTFLTWGPSPTSFKGVDKSTLGELVIAGQRDP
jgi:RNA polymerase sigma factor (sigma-70 family)